MCHYLPRQEAIREARRGRIQRRSIYIESEIFIVVPGHGPGGNNPFIDI